MACRDLRETRGTGEPLRIGDPYPDCVPQKNSDPIVTKRALGP